MTGRERDLLGRVGVLLGGTSAEREISLQSGQAVLRALDRLGVEAVAIDPAEQGVSALPAMVVDRVFIALHGVGGEDGTVQGALAEMGVPYTGCGVLASALGMDKWRCKLLWRGLGLPTPDFVLLDAGCDWQRVLDKCGGKVMVKPVHEGSSLGMAPAESADELERAWHEAARYDSLVMAERWIQGREFTVGLLDPEVLPAIELVTNRRFYDYEAKYLSDTTRYLCPADLGDADSAALADLARKAFAAIGGTGWGRVDIMADGEGRFTLLEVNTIPGLTDHSLVPMAARAAGIEFDQLVERILRQTLPGRSA